MIEHTPEPWKWHAQGEANEYCLLTHDGRWVIAFRQNGELTDDRQKANARRIVACVNACKGIPNEQLEMDSAAFINVFNAYNRLRHQQKSLLAALNLIETDKDGDGFICREAMEQVREAIAQAEGVDA